MKEENKLWKEYIKEREEENPERKRIFSVETSLNWHSELIPFYKSLILWGYNKGKEEKV